MNEYSRILIEDYCMNHTTKKSKQLSKLLVLSYNIDAVTSDADAIFLEKVICSEKDSELKEALQELDKFLFG